MKTLAATLRGRMKEAQELQDKVEAGGDLAAASDLEAKPVGLASAFQSGGLPVWQAHYRRSPGVHECCRAVGFCGIVVRISQAAHMQGATVRANDMHRLSSTAHAVVGSSAVRPCCIVTSEVSAFGCSVMNEHIICQHLGFVSRVLPR